MSQGRVLLMAGGVEDVVGDVDSDVDTGYGGTEGGDGLVGKTEL